MPDDKPTKEQLERALDEAIDIMACHFCPFVEECHAFKPECVPCRNNDECYRYSVRSACWREYLLKKTEGKESCAE